MGKSKELAKLRSIAIPLVLIILATFFFIGSIGVLNQSGFQITIPWIGNLGGSGQSGGTTITLPNGTTITTSIIPINQVSFKLMLVGTDVNGVTTTVFERSTLPGLALLGPNGKILKTIDLLGIVAVKSSTFFSSGAKAHFIINYSSTVGDTGKWKGRVVDITVPMTNDGTLALASLPPLRMLDQEIFPTHTVCIAGTCHQESDQSIAQGQQRQVDWNVNAQVTITAPNFSPLSLFGSTGATAEFNWDGSFNGGCTNCGTETGGTIGGAIVNPAGTGSLTENKYVEPPGPVTPSDCSKAGSCTSTSTSSSTVSPTGTVTTVTTTKVTNIATGIVVREFSSTSTGTSTDRTGTVAPKQGTTPGTKTLIAVSLLESPFGYNRFDLSWLNGNIYLLNAAWIILGIAVFAALAVALFVLLYLRPKWKRRK